MTAMTANSTDAEKTIREKTVITADAERESGLNENHTYIAQ